MVVELRVKIPKRLKERLESGQIDIDSVVQDALEKTANESDVRNALTEANQPPECRRIEASDIPPGSYMKLPGLSIEEYERMTDESSWEYIEGMLIHHSPESNLHNAILNFLIYRAKKALDPHRYIVRASRIALSIASDKPEPDFMVFDKDDFRKVKRKDGSDSEIIDSAPILVIEIVSDSSKAIDEIKRQKYLSKGIKEFWQVAMHASPIIVKVHDLKLGAYEIKDYDKGEVRSRHLPDFSVNVEDLSNPDGTR
nr:Uma2 family endonuclease [Candidatus Sigynarchaeota archaeon]